MTQEELNERAKKAVLTYNINESKKVAQDALDQNADIVDLIQNGFTVGINQVGDLYEQKKLFLPHIMAAANAMNAGVDILTPHLGAQAKTSDNLGKFVICTIEGDIHSIGKDIAAIMLKVAGFDVINLGRDIPLKDIAKAVADNNAIAVGTSALMTSTTVEHPSPSSGPTRSEQTSTPRTLRTAQPRWSRLSRADFEQQVASGGCDLNFPYITRRTDV